MHGRRGGDNNEMAGIASLIDVAFIPRGCIMVSSSRARGYFTQFAPLAARPPFFTVIEQFPGAL